MNATDLDSLTPREAATRALEAIRSRVILEGVGGLVEMLDKLAAELRAAPAPSVPAAYENGYRDALNDAMHNGLDWTCSQFMDGPAPSDEPVAWRWREYRGPQFMPDGRVWSFATHKSTGPQDAQEPLYTRPSPRLARAEALLRRLMDKLREECPPEDQMAPFAFDADWELLANNADAFLKEPSNG